MIETCGERELGKSLRAAQDDNDDDDESSLTGKILRSKNPKILFENTDIKKKNHSKLLQKSQTMI